MRNTERHSERHEAFLNWLDKATQRMAIYLVIFIFVFLFFQVLRTYNLFQWLQ